MARCPDCCKFVAFESQEPEVNSEEIDDDGTVTLDVRIVNACADCGTELTEAELELTETVDISREPTPEERAQDPDGKEEYLHEGDGHELSVECESPETAEKYEPSHKTLKSGKRVPVPFRFQTHYYGASVPVKVMCSCQTEPIWEGTLEEFIAGSSMDSCV